MIGQGAHSVDWLKLKGLTVPSIGKNVKQLRLSYTVCEILNYYNQLERLNICPPFDLAISLVFTYITEMGTHVYQNTCIRLIIEILFVIAKTQNQPKLPINKIMNK